MDPIYQINYYDYTIPTKEKEKPATSDYDSEDSVYDQTPKKPKIDGPEPTTTHPTPRQGYTCGPMTEGGFGFYDDQPIRTPGNMTGLPVSGGFNQMCGADYQYMWQKVTKDIYGWYGSNLRNFYEQQIKLSEPAPLCLIRPQIIFGKQGFNCLLTYHCELELMRNDGRYDYASKEYNHWTGINAKDIQGPPADGNNYF